MLRAFVLGCSENMDTGELARDKAYEFLFVLGHPRFKGGVQSMINPVAIR